jgi:hypothetical protein
MQMTKKRSFTGLLVKPIHLAEAKAGGLHGALGLGPDGNDFRAHVREGLEERCKELDKYFGLQSMSPDIWKQRARALIAREFGIPTGDPQWWSRLTLYMACKYAPGFAVKRLGEKKHGAPKEWDFEQLACLFADIEFLKRKDGSSVRKICEGLPRRNNYGGRWGRYKSESLRRAYAKARKLYKESPMFKICLCGLDALVSGAGVEEVERAIELHAVRI